MIEDCVSAFPSVTPVCTSEIATGATADRHWIPGMNWYHRVEQRYVEYGSSFEATRAFGLFRATYDIVYNMNMAHLSHEVETFFETLGDAGIRTACTPFLIYRGRTRHEVSLEGLLKRGAVAAGFRHAVYGPDELFYGELFGSRPVPCKPTLARPGTRDEYSACVSKELVADDAYDFLLFSLPDNDHHSHRWGPDATPASIAHADRCFGELVEACGGMDKFLETHAVILVADHAQTDVTEAYELIAELEQEWRVLQPSSDTPETAELAVSPAPARVRSTCWSTRTARPHATPTSARASAPCPAPTWSHGSPAPTARRSSAAAPARPSKATRAPRPWSRRRAASSASAPAARASATAAASAGTSTATSRRSALTVDGPAIDSTGYPDALDRLWSALVNPHSGDVIVSLAEGYECVDWGQTSHVGGGSHGSLLASDSLAPARPGRLRRGHRELPRPVADHRHRGPRARALRARERRRRGTSTPDRRMRPQRGA